MTPTIHALPRPKLTLCRWCDGEGYRTVIRKSDRHNAPEPFNIDDPEDMRRLVDELCSYMRISRKDGTDTEGREFAYQALLLLSERDRTLSAKEPTP